MNLSKKEIVHIAQLARLHLTEKEIVQYRREISGIISYLEHLAEINISKKEATPSLASRSALRRDEAKMWIGDEREQTVKSAKVTKNNYISVPRIFES